MSAHIVSPRIYWLVFSVLVLLTLATTAAASVDLGPLNTVVALTIAVCKASLVVLYFMHVRHSARLTWVFIGAGVVWLAILIALTLSDALTRAWIPLPLPWSAAALSPGTPP